MAIGAREEKPGPINQSKSGDYAAAPATTTSTHTHISRPTLFPNRWLILYHSHAWDVARRRRLRGDTRTDRFSPDLAFHRAVTSALARRVCSIHEHRNGHDRTEIGENRAKSRRISREGGARPRDRRRVEILGGTNQRRRGRGEGGGIDCRDRDGRLRGPRCISIT